ncbi:MAG: lipoxygenase family protein [Microcystaceae cyanobacterium]
MPSLPQKDTAENQANRKAQLANKQKQYVFDPKCLPPLTVIKEVPITESFSPKYLAERVPATLGKLSANSLAVKVKSHWDPLDDLQDFEDFYPAMTPPSVMRKYQMDESFGEQRLSGCNPMVLRAITELPPTFSYSLQEVQEAYSPQIPVEQGLGKELAAGNLYVADYQSLSFIQGGTYLKGKKYFPAPVALFVWRKSGYGDRGQLMPVAIQIDSKPGQKAALLTPNSLGHNWLYAKICMQIADANHHEMASHLCHTHLVMEPFAVSTSRRLSSLHPLYLLLRPHFRFMLFNNDMARKRLINQGGIVDDLLAGTIGESLQIVKDAYEKNAQESWSLDQFALPTFIKNRGLDDMTRLPHYPYRDDGQLLWDAIADYVGKYLGLYYTNPDDITNDYELQSWIAELADQGKDGGKVKGIPTKLETVEQLAHIVTAVIYTCSAQHSAVNFTQYDYMGFIPNAPLAAYQPIKSQFKNEEGKEEELTLQELLAFLPPSNQVVDQINIMYTLGAYRYDRLGYYDEPFSDDQAQMVSVEFQRKLNEIEQAIDIRNQKRVFPYKVLKPSLVINSISI